MCCLFGFIDYNNSLTLKQKNKVLSVLSKECEARGTDATGIAFNDKEQLRIFKKALPAHKAKLYVTGDARVVMGHTRMTTKGTEKHNYNNHPFSGSVSNADFALAHNGVLRNDELLRKSEGLPETGIETDSFIAVQLIEKERTLDFDSIRNMAEKVTGSFCFTVLDDMDNLYFVKGDNPMTIYDFPQLGFIIYASTADILNKAIKRLKINKTYHEEIRVSEGEILRIDSRGEREKQTFEFHDYFMSSFFSAFDYHGRSHRPYELDFNPVSKYGSHDELCYDNEDYINELKEFASAFGMSAEAIDYLIECGLSTDEIEDIMYSSSSCYSY